MQFDGDKEELKTLAPEALALCQVQHQRLLAEGKNVSLAKLALANGFLSKATSGSKDASLAQALPVALCQKFGIRPVQLEGGLLVLDGIRPLSPADEQSILSASRAAHLDVSQILLRLVDRSEFLLGQKGALHDVPKHIAQLEKDSRDGVRLQMLMQDMFAEALTRRASDIHLDRSSDPLACWISYRIDGSMQYQYLLPREVMAGLVTRIKTEANMDPSDTTKPQDGRISLENAGRAVDVRCSTILIDGGETLAIRMLDPDAVKEIDELFLDDTLAPRMKRLAGRAGKNGAIVLITGPTGSGKSTTLLAMMKAMPRYRINVMTAEDPVEYKMPLTRQVPVNAAAGRGFATILRTMLRQDPDVLVIGELRDGETAEIALHTAETGHMMLGTLHTEDAPQAIERFVGMLREEDQRKGRYILASYLQAIVNQKLVKLQCACCLPDLNPNPKALAYLGINADAKLRVRNPEGCSRCQGRGYFNRAAVAEAIFFSSDRESRSQVLQHLLAERPVTDLLNIKGVTYVSRIDSLRPLVEKGLVSLEQALDLLDVELN